MTRYTESTRSINGYWHKFEIGLQTLVLRPFVSFGDLCCCPSAYTRLLNLGRSQRVRIREIVKSQMWLSSNLLAIALQHGASQFRCIDEASPLGETHATSATDCQCVKADEMTLGGAASWLETILEVVINKIAKKTDEDKLLEQRTPRPPAQTGKEACAHA